MSDNNSQNNKSNFFNLEQLKTIPIEDVCHRLGLDVKHKGSRIWVKIRNERTASAVINPDKNTFYDFGSQEHGDAIDLVALINNSLRKDAIEQLANMFNIEPVNPRQGFDNQELNLWEYAKIGIYGDMVSKNLNFNPDLPSSKLFEIADKLSMSVNELRKKNSDYHKNIYENSIIRNKALPFIQDMRNSYFLSIWEQYTFLRDIKALEMFDMVCAKPEFEDMYQDIIIAEKIFNRAVEGTNVKEFPKRDYSPNKILQDILGKTIKPELGPLTFNQMKKLSTKEDSALKYKVVDYAEYVMNQPSDIHHSAFLDAESEKAVICYLEKDKQEINNVFGLTENKKKGFNDLVNNAEKRKKESIQNSSIDSRTK